MRVESRNRAGIIEYYLAWGSGRGDGDTQQNVYARIMVCLILWLIAWLVAWLVAWLIVCLHCCGGTKLQNTLGNASRQGQNIRLFCTCRRDSHRSS